MHVHALPPACDPATHMPRSRARVQYIDTLRRRTSQATCHATTQEFVDIEAEEAIEVSITTDPQLGTVYSVNIPIRRVKPEARFGNGLIEGQVADGITLEWDPADWDKDPAARFPMGC
jgi:hypothetical protein